MGKKATEGQLRKAAWAAWHERAKTRPRMRETFGNTRHMDSCLVLTPTDAADWEVHCLNSGGLTLKRFRGKPETMLKQIEAWAGVALDAETKRWLSLDGNRNKLLRAYERACRGAIYQQPSDITVDFDCIVLSNDRGELMRFYIDDGGLPQRRYS